MLTTRMRSSRSRLGSYAEYKTDVPARGFQRLWYSSIILPTQEPKDFHPPLSPTKNNMQLSQLSLIFAITASSALANEKGKPVRLLLPHTPTSGAESFQFDTGICNHQDTSWANGYCYGSGDHQYDTPLKCNDVSWIPVARTASSRKLTGFSLLPVSKRLPRGQLDLLPGPK